MYWVFQSVTIYYWFCQLLISWPPTNLTNIQMSLLSWIFIKKFWNCLLLKKNLKLLKKVLYDLWLIGIDVFWFLIKIRRVSVSRVESVPNFVQYIHYEVCKYIHKQIKQYICLEAGQQLICFTIIRTFVEHNSFHQQRCFRMTFVIEKLWYKQKHYEWYLLFTRIILCLNVL